MRRVPRKAPSLRSKLQHAERAPRVVLLLAIALAVLAPRAWGGNGEKMYHEFREKGQIYPDERWQRYVQDVGERLLASAPKRGKNFHFRSSESAAERARRFRFFLVDSAQVNAFVAGDPYVFIHRGMLAFMNSEDELAGVLGHELGHIVERHIAKSKMATLTGKAIGAVASWLTLRREMQRDVADPLTGLLLRGHGREKELEADRIGAELMAYAGYDPSVIIDVVWALKDQQMFNKRVARKRVSYHGVFATHPRNDLRLHEAVGYARSLAQDEKAEPVGDFWAMMDGLAYGDEAAGGLVRDSSFYHTGLRVVVKFPDDWALSANRSRVRARAPGGNAEGWVTVANHPHVKRTTPRKYVTKVLRRDDLVSGEDLEIGGQPAFIGELDTADSNVQLQLIAVLYRGKDVYLFKGECGEKGDPERFRETFRSVVAGLRGMTVEDVRTANTRRIKVVVAQPGTTYAKLAKDSALSEHAVETLRLLNADWPNGEPRAGDYVKVVE